MSLDLNPLKIERAETGGRARARKGGSWVPWVVVLVVLGVVGWLFHRPLLALADRVRLPEVSVVTATRSSPLAASAVSGTGANGYIVAAKRAALSADTPGRIVEMNVTEGSVVKKGDVVARLYSDEYRAALRRTEADLEAAHASVVRMQAERKVAEGDLERRRSEVPVAEANVAAAVAAHKLAEINLARAQKLIDEHVDTQQRLDDARAELERTTASEAAFRATLESAGHAVQQAEMQIAVSDATLKESEARVAVQTAMRDEASATLEKTQVRAPFDGIVVLKDAEVGEVVSPNALGGQSRGSVVTMVDLASLEVQVEVPETNLAAVEIGASASIYLDAYPEQLYTGQVKRIWPTANRQKATVEVRVGFDTPDDKLRPEMGARVVFAPKGAPVVSAGAPSDEIARVLIPESALVKIGDETGVFVLERDVVRWRALQLGDRRSGRVVVLSGLEGGERLVNDPPNSLADGERVLAKE